MKYINKILNNQKFASSFIIYLVATLLLKGIGFITTPIFTRILSPSEYGIVTIFNTWVLFFAVFIGFQVSGSIATARIHKPPHLFDSYLKSITILSLLGAIIIAGICFLLKKELSSLLQIDVELIPHLLVQAYGLSCATFYSNYTIQMKQPKNNAMFSIIIAIIIVSLSLALIMRLQHDKYLGKIYSGTIVYFFVIIFVLKRFIFGQKSKLKLSDWKYSFALGAPLIIHLLANIIIGQSDRIFLKQYLGNESAAIYSVAYSVGTLGMLLVGVCTNIWSPWYLDNTKAGNHNNVNDVTKKYTIIISAAFVILMLIAPDILKIMAPKEYWSGVNCLIIIVVGVFFQFLYRFPLGYEQYSINLRWVAFCTITAALSNIVLNYFLISLMGMVGAAIATLISYIVLFSLHEIVARKIIKGYNIELTSYLLSIIGCLLFAIISYFLIDFWYIRYSILLLLIFLSIYYIIKNKDILKYN